MDGSMAKMRPIHWTHELVANFWDGISESRLDELSFSALNGKACIQVFLPFLDTTKSYLDFGGGDGHLAELLCSRGFRVATYDPSEGRTDRAKNRLSTCGENHLGFVGPNTQMKFDGIFLVEVAEHILDEDIVPTYERIRSLLASDGLLFLTTPNKEDLELGSAYEPQSGAFFHRWQHVRSFDRENLAAMLKRFDLHEVLIHEIDFRQDAFEAMNEAVAKAGLNSPFEKMRPVMMGARSNLVGIFCTEPAKVNVSAVPYHISIRTLAEVPAEGRQSFVGRMAARCRSHFQLLLRQKPRLDDDELHDGGSKNSK